MTNSGRFVFDARPAKSAELHRLVILSQFYASRTEGILQSVARATTDPPKTIIDIGAGTGHTSVLLKRMFPEATVSYFDMSKDLAAYAFDLAAGSGTELDFLLGDVLSFEFSSKYDLVFSRFAVKHFHDPERAVSILCRILNQGGTICLIDKDISSNIWFPLFPLYQTPFINALNDYNQDPMRGGDPTIGRKLRQLLTDNGITVEDEKLFVFNMSDNTEEIKLFRQIYVEVYRNLVPELVQAGLIEECQAHADIEMLARFLSDPRNTSISIDFALWGRKHG